MHEPGFVFIVGDWHVWRTVTIGHGRSDLPAQNLGVEFKRFAALALKT